MDSRIMAFLMATSVEGCLAEEPAKANVVARTKRAVVAQVFIDLFFGSSMAITSKSSTEPSCHHQKFQWFAVSMSTLAEIRGPLAFGRRLPLAYSLLITFHQCEDSPTEIFT